MANEGLSVSVNLTDDNLDIKLTQIAFAVGNLKPAMKLIGASIEQLVLLGFVDSEDPYGKEWERPPAHRTIGGQLLSAEDNPTLAASWLPLRDTGRLMGSITHDADNSSVRIGTNVDYAFYHQLGVGTNLFGGKIAERKFLPDLGLPPLWEAEVLDTLNDYLSGVLNA